MMNLVTIAPVTAVVLDKWYRALGATVELPGGTELIPIDEPYLVSHPDLCAAYVVNDPYFPRTVVGVTTYDLRNITPLATGSHGPRVGLPRAVCAHHRSREAAAAAACLPCYYARWSTRAIDIGLLSVDGVSPEDMP
jgi:hypothetical protein